MKAILSDIPGNLEALQAVLQDTAWHHADAIYCLGDLVGYGGPDPCGCLELALTWPVVLLGNHDRAVFHDPVGYGPTAYRAIRWAAAQLDAPLPDRATAARRWDFLRARPTTHREGDRLFVHGSPRNPLHEYVFPEDTGNERKMGPIFEAVGRCCFVGHTHVPGVFTEDLQFCSPGEIGYACHLGRGKTLVNVGSVGQPRDGDWRACYALLDGDNTVYFRRVEYDVGATVKKIRDIEGLDDFLGERLLLGR
jgi:diadenosine tetraphosphatase ApaH/serine/threonine PP2A family protein phosphatase